MSWNSGLQLRVLEGAQIGLVLPLLDRSVILGRATAYGEEADGYMFFYEATVSRQHAELRWDDRKATYWLIQKSQTNKTLVDNQKVEVKHPKLVIPGCKIQMGLLQLVLETRPF